MKKFIIENDFWDVFFSAKIGIVVSKNINNALGKTETHERMALTQFWG